jgi:NADH pyrophosphatase NudC (nudix superfamily)
MRDWRFCPRCGTRAGHAGDGLDLHLACPACGFVKYDNPLPTTIGLVVRDGRLLLLRRAIAPQRGWWDTVGGFISAGETAEQTMRRTPAARVRRRAAGRGELARDEVVLLTRI